jgi:hypothetical protein
MLLKPEQLIIIEEVSQSFIRFDKAMGIAPTRLAICFFMVV